MSRRDEAAEPRHRSRWTAITGHVDLYALLFLIIFA
jgi:hypothetical protein